ncbi:MAG: LOG family protein [Rickettsiales bacterium]|nr:LOG family protein [Rickettsiales bacterium]
MEALASRGIWIAPPTNDEMRPWRNALLASLAQSHLTVANKATTLGSSTLREMWPVTLQNYFDRHSGFVFGPYPSYDERYLASGLLACVTTGDKSLEGKHIVFDNSTGAWNGLKEMMHEQKALGMIKSELSEVATIAHAPDEITAALKVQTHVEQDKVNEAVQAVPDGCSNDISLLNLKTTPIEPKRKVVVFCSASLKPGKGNPEKIDAAAYQTEMRDLGERLVDKGYGVIFGGTDNGLMGALMAGVIKAKGWLHGVTIHRFFEKEGLKIGAFNKIDFSEDVHRRVISMVEEADAVVIAPGSLGTLHEAETVRYLLSIHHPVMRNRDGTEKPVYILNLPLKDHGHFWDGAIKGLDLNFGTTPQTSSASLVQQIAEDNFRGPDYFANSRRIG